MPYRSEDGLFEIATAYETAIAPILNVLCLKCGVRVVYNPNEMQIHRVFHEEIDELIDWAKSVSNVFAGPKPSNSAELQGEPRGSITERFNLGGSESGLQKGSD